MAVSYRGAIPDQFKAGADVVVEGKLDAAGTFMADVLLTKLCEQVRRQTHEPGEAVMTILLGNLVCRGAARVGGRSGGNGGDSFWVGGCARRRGLRWWASSPVFPWRGPCCWGP